MLGSESVLEIACAPARGLTMKRDTPPSIDDEVACGVRAGIDVGADESWRSAPWLEARLVKDSFRREVSTVVGVPMADIEDMAGGALDIRDWLSNRFAISSGS